MAEIGKQLSQELTRIIESPYPASLSPLAAVLTHASAVIVQTCIHDFPPCAVSRLATLVSEALPLWADALGVLSSLCLSPEFRDTFLLQNSTILDALLNKANASPREFDNYATLCVLLLSRPLPASIALPASAQTFFVRIFEKARDSPDVETLRPVYSMLSGACRYLPSLLPLETQQLFDQGLSHILSSSGAGQASMLLLWCFGIVLLLEHPDERGHLQIPQLDTDQVKETPKRVWKTSSGQKMFGSSSRMFKTVSLTTLSVIWASKGDVGVSDDDAVEGIRIAVRTLRFMERNVLDGWLKSSTRAMDSFGKLPAKILRENINPAVQLEALCFYAIIAGESNLPLNVLTQYESCLAKITSFVNADCFGEAISISLPLFSAQMKQSSIQTLIAEILNACISPIDSRQLSNYTTIIECITNILANHTSIRNRMASTLSSRDMQTRIWEFIRVKEEADYNACRAYLFMQHQEMRSAMVAFLLTLILTRHSEEPVLPHDLTMALISKQRQTPPLALQCPHAKRKCEPNMVSLFQQHSTPYTGQHLRDWRESLRAELESQGLYQRDTILRSVAQICQDLETRCDTIEEPLRREKKRSQELEQRILEMTERITSLETQAADDQFHIEGLDDEKAQIIEERDKLSAKLRDVEAEAHETTLKLNNVLHEAKEDLKARELELQSATITQEVLNNTILKLKEELQQLGDQHALANEQNDSLQHHLDDVEEKANNGTEVIRTQAKEIAQFKDRNIELGLQLQGTKQELHTATAELSKLHTSHQELAQSSEMAYKTLESKYALDMDAATFEAKKDLEQLNAQLQESRKLGQSVETAHDETKRQLKMLQISIPPLETRIEELLELCSEQEEELEELTNWRNNVFISMGLQTQCPATKRPAPRGQKRPIGLEEPPTSRQQRHKRMTSQPPGDVVNILKSTQGITNLGTAIEDDADAASVSSISQCSQEGSTPKHPKSLLSFKAPSMHTPYAQKPIASSRSRSAAKRLPPSKRSALRQLSPNRRHTTVGFTIPEDEEHSMKNRRGSFQGAEMDSDTEGLFAGTPLTPGNFLSGTGRIPIDDDQTIEL